MTKQEKTMKAYSCADEETGFVNIEYILGPLTNLEDCKTMDEVRQVVAWANEEREKI